MKENNLTIVLEFPEGVVFKPEDIKLSVQLPKVEGLPVLRIDTPPIDSKEVYVLATLKIEDKVMPMSIRGRGNSTWGKPKSPFKLKLDNKESILGIAADKEWAVLANWYDKSLMRNDVAFELSERLGRAYTPKRREIELIINNISQGQYLLTETIKAGADRVNIDTKNGGWLVEFNMKPDEGDPRFQIGNGGNWLIVDVKEGKVDKEVIRTEIQTLYDKLENYKFVGAEDYKLNFNLEDYVAWYLVQEITANQDGPFFSSVYVQKKSATDKIEMGPVWDFDLSAGNVNYGHTSPEGWYIANGNICQFIKNDDVYKALLKEKWNTNRDKIFSIVKYIEDKYAKNHLSGEANFTTWKGHLGYDLLTTPLETSVVVPGTYKGEVDYLKDWLFKRITWMDKEINK